MDFLLKNNRCGFPLGKTLVTNMDDETGIGFSILKMSKGEKLQFVADNEMAILHMDGVIGVKVEDKRYANKRTSLFDELPFAIHLCQGTSIELQAEVGAEFCLFETKNSNLFPAKVYLPENIQNEHRGLGLVNDTSYRHVRTIFDANNSTEEAQLVLGEVINMPGRWSSYPPHHHPQPEIYHYRFDNPKGFGHAEHGDDVYKVKSFDTLKIMPGFDHAQVSAPGYGMYYLWVIRHLDNARYDVPEFTKEHVWVMEKKE